ncbi:MAG: hypothetical protein JJU11_13615 [Candidatus Sumerlaeia bacterium]|nr:hypothetical protein [Candidatus Sumerlaeia bacterium]
MNDTRITELVVIGLYFVFMLATGILFRRYNHKFGDYFRSGCQGSWWLVGSSVFMASFTAWTFTGAVGVAYDSGMTVAIIFMANAVGYLINALITARWFRQMRAITYPEVVRARFDTTTQQFYVMVGVIPGLLTAGLTLWGVALFASSVFGFDQTTLIIVLGLIVLVYSTIGGLWGVMATDFLQAMILIPMTILVAVLSLQAIGGVGGFFAEIRGQELTGMLRLTESGEGAVYTPSWALAMIVFVIITYNSVGSSVKYFACKDGREASKAAGLAAILMFLGSILWIVPPIVARLKFPELVEAQPISKPSESAYAVIATQLLPAGLTGMIVVAMFAATMSSLSTVLNQFAAIVTQDVYKPFARPKATDREMFVAGQIATVMTGGLIVMMAVYLSTREGGGLFDFMLIFGSLFGTPMVVPMFLAMFVRKTPRWSAVVAVCVGFAFSFLGYISGASYAQNVFTIAATTAIAYCGTIPFWKYSTPEYKERVKEFYERMHRPVDFKGEVGDDNDSGQLRLIGWVSFAVGIFVLTCIVLPNPMAGRIQILMVSGFILLFGGMMVYAARRIDNRRKREV